MTNTWTVAEVAGALKTSPETFRRKHRRLCREVGFPAPLPGMGLRWSRARVLAWIDAGGVIEAAPAPRPATVVEMAKADLTARYA